VLHIAPDVLKNTNDNKLIITGSSSHRY